MKSQRLNRLIGFAAGLTFAVYCHAAPGDLDPTFHASTNIDWFVSSIAVQPDGKVIAGGEFTKRIIRLNSDGSFDSSFDPGPGGVTVSVLVSEVHAVALQSDGKVLMGGYFDHVNGIYRSGLARLNTNGPVDATFDTGTGAGGGYGSGWTPNVSAVVVQSDGKVIVGGQFAGFNGTNWNNIARLNADGSLDANFNPPDFNPLLPWVRAIALQADGRIIVAGGGIGLICLNTNGTVDSSFSPPSYYLSNPRDVAVQSDGKVLVGVADSVAPIIRLNPNGSLDNTFDASASAGENISCIALQNDGKVLLGGDYCIARFNGNGGFDTSFAYSGGGGPVYDLGIQADGKVLAGGFYLWRVFGHDPPRFDSLTRLQDGVVQLSGSSATNAHLRIEASSNLLNWDSLRAFVNTNGVFNRTDAEATNFPCRFYRALWLP